MMSSPGSGAILVVLRSCMFQDYEGFLYNDTCYYIHNEQPGVGGWYDAQSFCLTQLGGDLAYRHITDTDSIRELERVLWVGIRRRRWRWLTSAGRIFRMRYFNWDSEFEESRINSRVAITSRGSTWKNIAASTRLKHFMCSYVDDTYTTTERTISAQSQQTISAEPVTSSIGSETTTIDSTCTCDSKSFPVAVVVATVSVIIVLVIIIVVLAVALSKSRSHNKSEQTHMHMTTNAKVQNITDVSSENHREDDVSSATVLGDVSGFAKTSRRYSHEHIAHRDDPYEAISGKDKVRIEPSDESFTTFGAGNMRELSDPYEVTSAPSGNQHAVTYEDPNELDRVQIASSVNPYGVPSSYVNIVDKPSVYDSLHQ